MWPELLEARDGNEDDKMVIAKLLLEVIADPGQFIDVHEEGEHTEHDIGLVLGQLKDCGELFMQAYEL